MLWTMDTANPTRDESTRVSRSETVAARQQRIAREAELIAQARTSAAAGRTVPEEQVDAWIDSLNTDRELPPPRSGR
jgi:predicted transcriptional regulator